MAFQVYPKPKHNAVRPKAPSIRISDGRNSMTLSASLMEAMGNPTHVLLLIDWAEKSFAVAPSDGKSEAAFRLSDAAKRHGYVTLGVAFIDRFRIPGGDYITTPTDTPGGKAHAANYTPVPALAGKE